MVEVRRLLPRGYLFTVLGIAVGVAGLVALGAMAERITRFIDGGDRFVQGQVMLPLNPTTSQFLTLTQELILGLDPAVRMSNREFRELPVREGRALRAGDRGVVVVGADFAASRRLRAGGALDLATGRTFQVVGVLDKTLTAPDRFAIVPLDDARDLWLRRDPLLVQVFTGSVGGLGRGDLNTGAAVAWADGVDPDALARRIQAEVPGLNVTIRSEEHTSELQSLAYLVCR